MSNRVARLAQEIPTRQDVHPFRHVRPIRHKPPVPYGYVSHPEACYLLYVDMMEQLARKQEREEKAAEARDAMYRALAEEMAREALEREQHAAALRSASNAREAAALKEKRRRNKAKR
jgi:hypothetical protein